MRSMQVARTARRGESASFPLIPIVPYSTIVSEVRRPFLSDFVTAVRLLRGREKFTEHPEGRGFTGCAKRHPSCHSERSEESRSEYFQRSARFLVACGSSK